MSTILSEINENNKSFRTEADGAILQVTREDEPNEMFIGEQKTLEVTPDGITMKGHNSTGLPFENKILECDDWGMVKLPKAAITAMNEKLEIYDKSGTFWTQPTAIREPSGFISLQGLFRLKTGQTINVGDTIATLPEGFRPLKSCTFFVVSYAGAMRVDIRNDDGRIVVANLQSGATSSSLFVTLDGVRFLGEYPNVEA